jgi:hypothetical protein
VSGLLQLREPSLGISGQPEHGRRQDGFHGWLGNGRRAALASHPGHPLVGQRPCLAHAAPEECGLHPEARHVHLVAPALDGFHLRLREGVVTGDRGEDEAGTGRSVLSCSFTACSNARGHPPKRRDP